MKKAGSKVSRAWEIKDWAVCMFPSLQATINGVRVLHLLSLVREAGSNNLADGEAKAAFKYYDDLNEVQADAAIN